MRIVPLFALLCAGGAIALTIFTDHAKGPFHVPDDSRAQSLRARVAPSAPGVASLVKSSDGHFWAEAMVEAEDGGVHVRFLVDTGASVVALTGEDAKRLGFDLDALDYSDSVRTAGGPTRAAPVMLDRVTIAGVEARNVRAVVLPDTLESSLLGMSFLGRMSKVEATKDSLILRD